MANKMELKLDLSSYSLNNIEENFVINERFKPNKPNIKNNNYLQEENKNEKKNKLVDKKTTVKTRVKNVEIDNNEESDSLVLNEKMNFYEVKRKDFINYMTPTKVRNLKNEKKNKNKNNKKQKNDNSKNKLEEKEEISDLFSNSSTDNKNIVVSELDIELSNSNSNYFSEQKNIRNNMNLNSEIKFNNVNLLKKREIEFKKEIEQNLKKFLKNNQEKNNLQRNNIYINDNNNNNIINVEKDNHIDNKDNIKNKASKKQHKMNFYYLTDNNSSKNNNYSKLINNKNKNQNKISSFIALKSKFNFDYQHNYTNNDNNVFKNQKEYVSKNNANKKYDEIIKINISKKITNNNNHRKIQKSNVNKMDNFNKKEEKPLNYTNIYDIKSKIFYLQNKIKHNLFGNKIGELKDNKITYKKNNNINKKRGLNNFDRNHNINNVKNNSTNDYLNNSEKSRRINIDSNKRNYDSEIFPDNRQGRGRDISGLTKNDSFQKTLKERINKNLFSNNINDKNIIIQNFNCIDYNNINFNINNNIISKSHKFSELRDSTIKKVSNKTNKNNSLNKMNNFNSFKKSSTIQNTISKRGNLDKIKYLCDSYIKNSYKNNNSLNFTKLNTEKKNVFQRMHQEKKLTYKENGDIKNKILNYYLNQRDIGKNKTKYIKINAIKYKKNYNTTINNNSNKNNLINNEEPLGGNKVDIQDKISKQKTLKCFGNNSFSNHIFNNGKKKFIRPRKEKRNTQVCKNNIKKNLFEFKFAHLK